MRTNPTQREIALAQHLRAFLLDRREKGGLPDEFNPMPNEWWIDQLGLLEWQWKSALHWYNRMYPGKTGMGILGKRGPGGGRYVGSTKPELVEGTTDHLQEIWTRLSSVKGLATAIPARSHEDKDFHNKLDALLSASEGTLANRGVFVGSMAEFAPNENGS